MVIKQGVYDGKLIHERFAYKFFRKNVTAVGNIVAFRAPMYVKEELIDLEDSLTDDFIHSQDAINFCWEIPGLCPLGAVSFQRLFNTSVANILSGIIKKGIVVDGDDLLVQAAYFIDSVVDYFNAEVRDQFVATTKIIV